MKSSTFELGCKLTLLASLLASAGGAHADGWRWRTGFPSIPSASLDVRGVHFTDSGTSYASVTQARNDLYNGIKNNLNSLLQAEFQKIEGYQSGSGSVTVKGPIQLSITPNGTQTPVVSLSTFAVVAQATVKKSFGPLVGTCTVTVDTGSLNLSGNLDAANGVLNNLAIAGFVPSATRDCSSNVSWVPVLGSLVEAIANYKVDGILNKGLRSAMAGASQTFNPIKFAGLNVAIPAGRYVVKELNFDAGQYVVNNLQSLIASTPVSVRFGAPLPTLYAPSTYVDPVATPRYTQHDEAFSISFPSAPYGGIKFAVYDDTLFNAYWECVPMKPYCGPPNTD
jgi:hypothetical protein